MIPVKTVSIIKDMTRKENRNNFDKFLHAGVVRDCEAGGVSSWILHVLYNQMFKPINEQDFYEVAARYCYSPKSLTGLQLTDKGRNILYRY